MNRGKHRRRIWRSLASRMVVLAVWSWAGAGAQSLAGGTGANPLDPMQGTSADATGASSRGSRTQSEPLGSVPRGGNLEGGGDLEGGAKPEREERSAVGDDRRPVRRLDDLPPEKPTEFQQLVLNSTGLNLPVYGANLFRNAPSTFAPLDRVPVTADYVIGPGDELLLQLWGQVSLNSRVPVDRAGNIYIPQVGTLRVAGLQFAKLQGYLQSEIGKVFRNFDLSVSMGQLRSIQILVVGQARRPGSYTVSSLSTLVDAVFETGGPTPQGSLRSIQLKRAGKLIAEFDLYDLLERGDKSGDVPLLPGDVISIPPVGPQVAVAGSVNTPAIYELKAGQESKSRQLNSADLRPVQASAVGGSTLEEALALAGGTTSVASGGSVRLERIEAQSARSVMEVPLDASGRGIELRAGDIVEVVAIVDRYEAGVTLRGNVANPGHYAWKPGMRVSSLFPDKDALVTRDYWLKRSRLGQPGLGYVPACTVSGTSSAGAGDGNGCGAASSGSAAVSAKGRQAEDAAAKQDNVARSSAEAVVEQNSNRFELRNSIVLSEPDIDWNYAVIERQDKQTLTTSLLPMNLGRIVLDHDQASDLALEPGDVVTVFSKADIRVPQGQQTRLVYLEGEFLSSGVYSVQPGETLQQLVARAGGLSPDAYLYGSEFTRESTRRVQQQRLEEYINQLEVQAHTGSSGRSLGVQDVAADAAQQARSQSLLGSLRQARASGRVVLKMRPDSNLVAQIPALPLEDGDRFIVPQVPSTVGVAGAVYNPSSFLYDEHQRLRSYLDSAGGANREADTRRVYVIRADGSVISRQQVSRQELTGLRKDRFETLPIFPGDTIVVPLNLNKGGTLRNLVDVSQVVGQFGLAIAAAKLVF